MGQTFSFPFPCLIADIGGSTIRLACIFEPDVPMSAVQQTETARSANICDTIQQMIRAAGWPRSRSCLLAVAGPVVGQTVTLTNANSAHGPLSLDGRALAATLGLEQGLMLNDFEALSLALPFLTPEALLPVGGGTPVIGAPRMVIGAGTGLGLGSVLEVEGRILALASEGGHIGLGPQTPEDFALWPHLGAERVIADDLLSGRGLVRLYQALQSLKGLTHSSRTPQSIGDSALAGTDPLALEAVERFLAMLGQVAGDMALIHAARGGVFIGGGIAPRFAKILLKSAFRQHFEDKGSSLAYMRQIPTWLITAGYPTLEGLAALARWPQRFVLRQQDLWG